MKSLPSDEIITTTAGLETLAEHFRKKRIFISGGTGFFGNWMISTLIELSRQHSLGIELHVLTRDPSRHRGMNFNPWNAPEIHWYAGNIDTFDDPGVPFDYIIHAAAAYDPAPGAAGALAMVEQTTQGILRVIKMAEKSPPEALLFVSSGAVYGSQPPELPTLPECFSGAPDLASPSSAYGEAKRLSEFMLQQASSIHGFSLKIARCFSFLGPAMPLEGPYAAGNFIRDGILGRPIRVRGDGTAIRAYQHPADLVQWLFHILLRGDSSGVYNVGSDESVSMIELAERIASSFTTPLRIEVASQPDPSRIASRYVPDISRARKSLGLDLSFDLDRSLESAIKWFKI